jgi:sugar-specific transcriptional regulator TrmB
MLGEVEDIKALSCLGLTLLQAKVYLSLAVSGKPLTIKTISQATNIARQEAYRVTRELQEIALVERIVLFPNEYKAIPFQTGIEMLYQGRLRANEEARIRAIRCSERLHSHLHFQNDTDQFVIFPKSVHISRFITALMNAQSNFDGIISWKAIAVAIAHGAESHKTALKNGVVMRYISEKQKDQNEIRKTIEPLNVKGFEIRFVSVIPSIYFGIIDKKQIFIITLTSPIKNAAETPCLWSNNPGIIEIFEGYFDSRWRKAKRFIMKESRV